MVKKRLFDMDILTAFFRNHPAVTNNVGHFSRAPNLEVENWLEQPA